MRKKEVKKDSEMYTMLGKLVDTHIKALEEFGLDHNQSVKFELNTAMNVVFNIANNYFKDKGKTERYVEQCVEQLLNNVRETIARGAIEYKTNSSEC